MCEPWKNSCGVLLADASGPAQLVEPILSQLRCRKLYVRGRTLETMRYGFTRENVSPNRWQGWDIKALSLTWTYDHDEMELLKLSVPGRLHTLYIHEIMLVWQLIPARFPTYKLKLQRPARGHHSHSDDPWQELRPLHQDPGNPASFAHPHLRPGLYAWGQSWISAHGRAKTARVLPAWIIGETGWWNMNHH